LLIAHPRSPLTAGHYQLQHAGLERGNAALFASGGFEARLKQGLQAFELTGLLQQRAERAAGS